MIITSAARKRQLHAVATSFTRLRLPWLAPAHLRWLASQYTDSGRASQRRRKRSAGQIDNFPENIRHLATISEHTSSTPYDDAAVNAPVINSNNPDWRDAYPVSALRPAKDKIIVDGPLFEPSNRKLKVQNGITGSIMDMLQHLHTNLRVGRLDRAQAIVKRIGNGLSAVAPERIYAHTVYLQELAKIVMSHGKGSSEAMKVQQDMQDWYQNEISAPGIAPSGNILVSLTRAALHAMSGDKSAITIREYEAAAIAVNEEVHDELLYSEQYSDEEFDVVSEVLDNTEALSNAANEDLEEANHMPRSTSSPAGPAQQHFHRPDAISVEDLPQVRETDQVGQGLASVQRTIDAINTITPLPATAPLEQQRLNAMERQHLMEETTVSVAIDRWRMADEDLRKIGINTSLQTRPMGALVWQWYSLLLPRLQEELAECKKALANKHAHSPSERLYYGPYLELLSMDKVAADTILYILMEMTKGKARQENKLDGELRLSYLTEGLGRTLEAECKAASSIEAYKGSKARNMKPQARRRPSRKSLSSGNSEQSNKPDLKDDIQWPAAIRVKLGSMLISKLIEVAQLPVTAEHPVTKQKITQMQPAFLHQVLYVRGRRYGCLTRHASLTRKLQTEPVGALLAKRLPMIVEPQPWTGWEKGGYFHFPSPIMRSAAGDKSAKEYLAAAHLQGDLDQLYAGLNALGAVPWRINHDVLRVQLQAWNTGEAIGNFAPLEPQVELPVEPDDSAGTAAKKLWLHEVRELENKKSGMHSRRCFQNFQLEVARAMVNETLYFPHSIDFRGRAYPIPPYLNHMGADNARALLTFGQGKELGTEGLRWLKIHVANVAGYDKASLQEREDYTMAHLDDIRDSVQDPLEGRKWWLKSEDAWQTLAACFELIKALDSPDPTKYVSHLPVHQDGTCNGLQHYAALGGDTAGAAQVNLVPGDRPADIYSGVAKAVNELVEADAGNGNPIALKLRGYISRKVVKQPVMTNVYGVTFFGARLQIKKQIDAIFPDASDFSTGMTTLQMAHYLTLKVFQSLGSMFTGAQAIQSWLGQCADQITTCLTPEQIDGILKNAAVAAKSSSKESEKPKGRGRGKKAGSRGSNTSLFKTTIVWTTPLHLPVVQPYRSSKPMSIASGMQTITLTQPQTWDPVSRRKQLAGFPPNFIHSLDATHMLLSAIKCSEVGMTFASIHDSFWTHACDISRMSEVLRDAFVAMHSEDIISRLREEFITRYKDCLYLTPIDTKSKTGKEIQAWRKENKHRLVTQYAELAIEQERFKLLNSDNEDDVRKGREMVTPGSIFVAQGGTSNYAASTEILEQGLGAIPEVSPPARFKNSQDDDNDDSNADIKRPAPKSVVVKTHIWLPVQFPEVPKKGDFDVTALRNSRYFFH